MQKIPYRFLGRALLVLSPLFLFLLLAEVFLWLAGETVSVRKVALEHLPSGPPAAYMPAFLGQQINLLHYERVKTLRPKLLVLGSSRVTRFRAEMFEPGTDFYNSGRTISCIGDLEQYFDALPADYAPKTLLLGVDSWWFKSNLKTEPRFARDILQDETRTVNAHLYAYRKMIQAFRRGLLNWDLIWKIVTRQDQGVKRYGLIAWKSAGMRNDGSNQTFSRDTPTNYLDALPEDIQEILQVQHPALLPHAEVEVEDLGRFVIVLEKLQRRGTRIIGFVPPFSSEVLQAFAQNPSHFGYYFKYRQRITQIFREHGWYLLDGSDPQYLGLDDRCMKDRDHAQETYHVALLSVMAKDPEVCRALNLDPHYLKSLLNDPRTTPWYPVYPARGNQRSNVQVPSLPAANAKVAVDR